jgi:predicted transcriptional regulator
VREPARAAATLIPGRNRNTTTCESLQWLPCFRTKSSQGLSVSLIRVPQTQSTFHPHARQNAFRRRDARPQQKLFAWMNDLHVPKLFWELWPLVPVGTSVIYMRTPVITIRLGPELKQRPHNAARKLDLSENDIARRAMRAAVDWLEANDYGSGRRLRSFLARGRLFRDRSTDRRKKSPD